MVTHPDIFAILGKAIRISNSTVDVERRLRNMVELFRRDMAIDQVHLFFMDRRSGRLRPREFDEGTEILPPLTIADGFIGRAVTERRTVIQDQGESLGHLETIIPSWATYQSRAAFPIMDDQVQYGVLILLDRQARAFSPEGIGLIETIIIEMAGTIRNFRLYAEAKKRIADLSVMYEVGRAVSSTLELDQVLNTVVNITCKVLLAEGCALNVMDNATKSLRVAAEYGFIPQSCRFKHLLDTPNGLISRGVLNCVGRPTPYVGPAAEDPFCENVHEEGGDKSIICLPLHFKGAFKGTLCVYNKVAPRPGGSREFNREDLELLTTMGTMISSSLENALVFQTVDSLARHNELLLRSLSSLYEISGAMMTTFKMDELLAIITRALTLRQGLGFDRALVLVMSEEEDVLLGQAIREVSSTESARDVLPLAEALRIENIELEPAEQFSDFLRLRLPMTDEHGIMVRVAREKRSIIVGPEEDHARAYQPLPVTFGQKAYAAVAMLAKGKVVGVIAVDRDLTGSDISEADVRDLSMLANQAGLAIENSRLYEYIEQAKVALSQTRGRLIEAEKLAALGEMAAGMAHEIRNPLVSIGGFTRRLLKSMTEDSPQRFYVQVIINEVTRLEKTLSEVLDFSRDSLGQVGEHNLNDVITEALYVLRREFKEGDIEVVKNFHDLPTVMIDERQIKHVLFNLFFNACQAMGPRGRLTLSTSVTKIGDRAYVCCEVSDTGPGVPIEVLPNIFNPFFTTKDTGTGLGLSIVHKIITRHHGEIDVVSREGQGATFIFKLPVAAESGLYLK